MYSIRYTLNLIEYTSVLRSLTAVPSPVQPVPVDSQWKQSIHKPHEVSSGCLWCSLTVADCVVIHSLV